MRDETLIRLPAGMLGRIKELAALKSMSMNIVITRCLQEHLELYHLWPLDMTPEKAKKLELGRHKRVEEQHQYRPVELSPEQQAMLEDLQTSQAFQQLGIKDRDFYPDTIDLPKELLQGPPTYTPEP